MSIRLVRFAGLLAFLILLAIGSAFAESNHDPIIQLDSSTKMEIDVGMMVDDLLPPLLESISAEDEDSAEVLRFLLDKLGYDCIDILKVDSRVTKEKVIREMELTLNGKNQDGLFSKLFKTPNASCGFADYVRKDNLVMFSTLHNFSHYLRTILEVLAQPEIAGLLEDFPVDENGHLVFGAFDLNTDLLPLLSGELDFFILESADGSDITPLTAPYFLVLGSTDGFALRDRILELVGQTGLDLTAMLESVEPEILGDFEFKIMPMGGALAVSEEYLVLALNPDQLRDMLAEKSGNLKVPDGIEWFYMDGPKYGFLMESIMEMAAGFSSETSYENEFMAKVYGVLFESVETEEILVRTRKNALEIRTEIYGPFMTGLYEMTYVMLQELPELMQMQRLKEQEGIQLNDYQSAINSIDKAMVVFAEDHGGYYPDSPEELFTQGYMDELPDFVRTPAGQFQEWGYTYLTLKDDDGNAEGYYLFLYGGDEEDGFDVFTPENLQALDDFYIARDGAADGVASFCYDGTAIERVDRYFSD